MESGFTKIQSRVDGVDVFSHLEDMSSFSNRVLDWELFILPILRYAGNKAQ